MADVQKELRAALDTMRGERDRLDKEIAVLEGILSRAGAPVKRGPGRPKGSGVVAKRGPGRPRKTEAPVAAEATPVRRGPGRPKGSKNKAVKRGPGRPKGSKAAQSAGTAASRRAPKWSPAAREAARARMKAYWAERKKRQGS